LVVSATAARRAALVRIVEGGLTDSTSEISIAVPNGESGKNAGLILRSGKRDNRAGLIFVDDRAAYNFGIERGDATKGDVLPAKLMFSM
jgi:hypothetical protein